MTRPVDTITAEDRVAIAVALRLSKSHERLELAYSRQTALIIAALLWTSDLHQNGLLKYNAVTCIAELPLAYSHSNFPIRLFYLMEAYGLLAPDSAISFSHRLMLPESLTEQLEAADA